MLQNLAHPLSQDDTSPASPSIQHHTPIFHSSGCHGDLDPTHMRKLCLCSHHQTTHLGLASLCPPIVLRGQQPALASSPTESSVSFLKTAPFCSIPQHIHSVLSSSLRIALGQNTSRQRNRLQGVFPTHPWHFYSSVHSKTLLKFCLPSNSSCLPFLDLPTISSLAK